jgi:polyphenol oxidase
MLMTCHELAALSHIRHGFFTRRGGVSHGLYASLNCGPGSGDDMEHVRENRARVAASLHVPAYALVTAHQIHSPTAVTVTKPWQQGDAPQADALVTATPGIALGVLTADCVPVLFAAKGKHVIGAAHAGWKGAIGGVLEATLAAMQQLGANPADVVASIGPAISQSSYEVGDEFHDRFAQESPENARFFVPSTKPGHQLFDLTGYVRMRLARAGVGTINLLAQDTRMQEDVFFSFRRATLAGEPVYGRQISAITLAS